MDPIEQIFRDQATQAGNDPESIEQIIQLRRARKAQQTQKKATGLVEEETKYQKDIGRTKEFELWKQENVLSDTEQTQARALMQLKSDIRNYKPLKDLARYYKDVIPNPQIVSEYNAFHSQSGSPWGPATESAEEVERMQLPIEKLTPELTAEEKKKKGQVEDLERALNLLEKNLKQAELRGPAAGRLSFLSTMSGGALFPEVTDYEALRKGLIGPVARVIAAEVGVLTQQDINRAEDMLPKLSDTIKTSERKLANIRTLLQGKKGETPSNIEDLPQFFQSKKKEQIKDEESDIKKELFIQKAPPISPPTDLSPIQKIGKKVSEIAPIAGGIAAGLGGAVLGAGAVSLLTGAAGTAIGTGAGIAFGETLEDLLGIQDETPSEQLRKGITTPATAAALDLATAGVFAGGGKIVKTLGSKIFNLGENLALRSIRPSPSQQKNFFLRTGIRLKDFVIEKGLFKKGTEQVDEIIDPLQKSFDDIALRSNKQIPLDNVVKTFDDRINQFLEIPTDASQKIAKKLTVEKDLFLDRFGEKIAVDVSEITRLRRKIDNLIPTSKWIQDPIASGAERSTRGIYQDLVREGTEGITAAGGKSLKSVGQELKKLYEFRDIALAQEGLGRGTLPFGVKTGLQVIAATGGGAYGAYREGDVNGIIKYALLGYGAAWAANNPRIISFVARNLTTIGKGLEGLSTSQKQRVIVDSFRRLLSNIAAVKMTQFGQEEE